MSILPAELGTRTFSVRAASKRGSSFERGAWNRTHPGERAGESFQGMGAAESARMVPVNGSAAKIAAGKPVSSRAICTRRVPFDGTANSVSAGRTDEGGMVEPYAVAITYLALVIGSAWRDTCHAADAARHSRAAAIARGIFMARIIPQNEGEKFL